MQEYLNLIRDILLFVFLTIATYQDIKSLKIKNYLSISMICTGILLSMFLGTEFVIDSLQAVAISFVIGLILFALGVLGAGDVKLIMGIGAFRGVNFMALNMLYTLIVGAVISILFMIKKSIFIKRMKYLLEYFKLILFLQKIPKYQNLDHSNENVIPFAIFILIASILNYIFKDSILNYMSI